MNSGSDSSGPQTLLKILEVLTNSSKFQKFRFYLKSPSSLALQNMPLLKLNQKNIHYDLRLYLTPQDILQSNPNLLNLDLLGLYVGSEDYFCEWKSI